MSEPKPTFDSRGDIGATDPARGSHVSRKTAGRSRGGAGGWLDFSQAPKILWFIIKPTKLTIKIRTATCTGICIYIILYIYIHIYVDTCTSRMPYSRFDLVQSPCIFWSKSEKVCLKSTFPFVNLTLVEFDFIKIILAHSSFNHIPSSTI